MNSDAPQTLLERMAREPLIQFLALGALIFAGFWLFDSAKPIERPQIIVDDAVIARISGLYEKQFGNTPEAEQLNKLIDTYIREQILYREALRLHLDENDEIVRRRLIQKMEFLASRSIEEPTDEVLRQYYNAHLDQFKQPARVSFDHLYFSPDNGGAQKAVDRAKQALNTLNSALNSAKPNGKSSVQGDSFPLQAQYSRISHDDAVQLFGTTPLPDALFSSPIEHWFGPLASGYGWHIVRISERIAERNPSYEEAIEQVKDAYESGSGELQTQKAIDEISTHYAIIRTARAKK